MFQTVYSYPVFLMLKNTSTNKFHPILYAEKPLPGQSFGSLSRWKSVGHSTSGFDSLEAAVADVMNKCESVVKGDKEGSCVLLGGLHYDLDEQRLLEWDGQDMPASVMTFDLDKLTKFAPLTEDVTAE